MAIFLLVRDRAAGAEQRNDMDTEVVEAANAAAARTAAQALSSEFPANWWAAAVATVVDISTPGTYNGGLFKLRLDNGV